MKIKRTIKYWFQRRTRGWSDDECWNVDYSFIVWFNEHLKVYKKQASEHVNLEYHTFTYKRKKYTQLELIDKLIELTDNLKNNYWVFDESYNQENIKNEILDIFKLIFFSLWW